MDQKQMPTLDPKLKEAYDRVMGTAVPPPYTPNAPVNTSSPTPTPTVPAATGANQTPPVHTMAPAPDHADTSPMPHATTPPAGVTVTHHVTPTLTPSPSSTHVAGAFVAKDGGKSKISPAILVFAAIVFFLVYTLFWVRFFNVPIPFLSQ